MCVAMSLSSAALAVALRTGVASGESLDVLQGICRELLAGSTEGRQALVGSCWFGPLPILASTFFAWFDAQSGAGLLVLAMTAWCGWSLAIYRLGRIVSPCRAMRLLAQASAAVGVAASGGALQPAVALPVWLGVMAAGACADWSIFRRLGALATLGFALAALALCGVCLSGWVVLAMAVLAVVTWRANDVRGRLPAVLMLGWLPLFYALGVWALLNWLLLGHPLYFVRPLFAAGVLAWGGWPDSGSLVARLIVVFGVAATILAGARRRPDGVVLGVFGLGAWGWAHVLSGYSAGWAAGAALPLSVFLCVAAVVRTLIPPPPVAVGDDGEVPSPGDETPAPAWRPRTAAGVAVLLLLALAAAVWRDMRRTTRAERLMVEQRTEQHQAIICSSVADYVQRRTPYGRVFVCGYEGLGLLRNRPANSILIPNMDLHLGEMRRQYHGQNLFVLLHRPEGRAAADSVHVRLTDAYRLGFGRTLYARDFGEWRLFEVVGAPTAEQLREWQPK